MGFKLLLLEYVIIKGVIVYIFYHVNKCPIYKQYILHKITEYQQALFISTKTRNLYSHLIYINRSEANSCFIQSRNANVRSKE